MKSEALRRNTTYPLADWYPRCIPIGDRQKVKAVWTGEKRKPRKGEWYLSGSIIAAYLAPSDLSYELHIAKLVITDTQTITTIIGDYPT